MQLLTCLLLSFTLLVPLYLVKQATLLTLFPAPLLGEILHGLLSSLLGRVASTILAAVNRFEEVLDQKKIFRSKYNKLFYAQLIPAAINIAVAYTTFLNRDALYSTTLSLDADFQSDRFDCREQQVRETFLLTSPLILA